MMNTWGNVGLDEGCLPASTSRALGECGRLDIKMCGGHIWLLQAKTKQYSWQKQLQRRRGLLWFNQRVQLITVRKACWEEREAANHTASTVGSRDGAGLGFSVSFSPGSQHGEILLLGRVSCPTSVNSLEAPTDVPRGLSPGWF